ncbi:ATP-binding response regulator [Hyalangium versicolor]|uniref:ATP-binding response regulator n=1 Tax=Hyalangium versicolor TaxID=2861190 RepID=UPI001CCC4B55|nr:response regulator [Hyalangium versicolor]
MSQSPIRVLLIEDDEDDYVLVREALNGAGLERVVLDWCDEPERALELLGEARHDVALLDYHLGSWTGIQLLREARSRGCLVPVILLTGAGNSAIDHDAQEAGASDFLVKSQLSAELLERAIRYTLQHGRMMEAVRRSQSSFRELIEQLPDAITVWHQKTLIYANAALVAMLGGSSADEFTGRSGLELETVIHPEDREILLPVMKERLSGARSMRELRFVRLSGGAVPVEVAHFPVTFDGKPCSMWIARDLTERRQMHARLMLSDRMVSLGTLAVGIGHELNNPLAYVMANLSHLEKDLLPGLGVDVAQREELRALVSETQQGVQRIHEITQQLKLFSQVERETRSTRVDVHQVLENSVRLASNEIRHRARLVREYTDPLVVEAQEARLGQVFLNLLVNAAHAIPEGAVERHEIRVVTRRREGLAIIEIRDTGQGIPQELHERIFEPFLSLRPGGTTGLGLSICLGIVTGFNGRMEVESKLGQGSVFRVILPAVDTQPVSASSVAAPAPVALRRGRVLSVDDEPLIGVAIARALKQEHDVTALTSGREALAQLIRGERYDLILCDIMMPEMSGMELYEEISRLVPEQAERMVFLTGGAFTPMARAFLGRVKNRCMEKPFAPSELRKLVRSWIIPVTGETASTP